MNDGTIRVHQLIDGALRALPPLAITPVGDSLDPDIDLWVSEEGLVYATWREEEGPGGADPRLLYSRHLDGWSDPRVIHQGPKGGFHITGFDLGPGRALVFYTRMATMRDGYEKIVALIENDGTINEYSFPGIVTNPLWRWQDFTRTYLPRAAAVSGHDGVVLFGHAKGE